MPSDERVQDKTLEDLLSWLEHRIAPVVRAPTELIAHGGTALTLLRRKRATHDVDFGIRDRAHFERFREALESRGYKVQWDLRASPREALVRLRNPADPVDLVDLRHPTWNNWRVTPLILRGAARLHFGELELVCPVAETIFLFKTYPLRESDLDDLRGILAGPGLDEPRVLALLEEQDRTHRRELFREDLPWESLYLLLDLRCRFAASLALLGDVARVKVPRLREAARQRYRDLGLSIPLPRMIGLLRSAETGVDWEKVLGGEMETLRSRLLLPEGSDRVRSREQVRQPRSARSSARLRGRTSLHRGR